MQFFLLNGLDPVVPSSDRRESGFRWRSILYRYVSQMQRGVLKDRVGSEADITLLITQFATLPRSAGGLASCVFFAEPCSRIEISSNGPPKSP